jgi:hypothetical protein
MAADLRACSDTAFLSGSGVEVAHAPLIAARWCGGHAAAVPPAAVRWPRGGPAVAFAVLLSWPRRCRARRRACRSRRAAAGDAAAGTRRQAMRRPGCCERCWRPRRWRPWNLRCWLRLSGRVTGCWRGRLTLTRRHGRQERRISSPSNVMIGALPRYLPLPLPSGSLPGHLRNPLISARASGSDTVCPPSVRANCHQ